MAIAGNTRKHKGKHEYSNDESSNISLGQLGFKVLATTGNTGNGFWSAIKLIGSVVSNAKIATVTLTFHDDTTLALTNVATGEMLYGPFKKVAIDTPDTNVQCLAYYG
jgi:hypothetical protein